MTTTSESDGSARPVPDASHFRPRHREGPFRGRQTWTTIPEWKTLTASELDALPVGTRRSVPFGPGVYVGLLRTDDGWTLLTRHRIPSDALVGLRSAPRVPIDPDDER